MPPAAPQRSKWWPSPCWRAPSSSSSSTHRSSTSRCRRSARPSTSPRTNLSWVVNAYTLDLRRLPAPRRPPRRPARPAAHVHRRSRAVLRRLAGRRPGPDRGVADRRPRRAGPRRRAPLPRRALDRDHHVRARAPSATPRSASGAPWPAPAARPASCSAACSPSGLAGSGCSSSTCRSPRSPRSSRRACCRRAATRARRATSTSPAR